jgi:hypothetical protein
VYFRNSMSPNINRCNPRENLMEKFAELISILLQHSQRFFDIWNFQILVSLAVIGFVLSNHELVSQRLVRLSITVIFLLIAAFSVYTLSVHNQREIFVWTAIESRIKLAPDQFTPEEIACVQTLKPSPFFIKAGALLVADLLVILITWISPKLKNRE